MSERDATTFGQWLRRRRKGLGLTQAELARKVGCATITVQKIEADERRPSRDMASWLAEAFEIGLSERQRFLRLARAGRTLTTRDQAALDRRPTNLPLVLPQLIGRARDLQMAQKRLLRDGVRLLSITGPPGVGKTTLSIHLGVEVLSAFEDGAFFVPLADACDPPAVAAAAAGCGDLQRAARALGAAEGVVESNGIVLEVEDTAERDRTTIAIRAVLDEAVAHAQRLEGRKMAVAPAIVLDS